MRSIYSLREKRKCVHVNVDEARDTSSTLHIANCKQFKLPTGVFFLASYLVHMKLGQYSSWKSIPTRPEWVKCVWMWIWAHSLPFRVEPA